MLAVGVQGGCEAGGDGRGREAERQEERDRARPRMEERAEEGEVTASAQKLQRLEDAVVRLEGLGRAR